MTISRSSIALSWRNQLKQEVEELSLDKFLSSSTLLLKSFKKTFGPRIGRLACICQRFARSDASGRFLAGHFCRPALLETPFNRPENFEIHSHKVFPLFAGCKINSWMRVKTAQLSAEPAPAPLVIIAEQDFNTLLEEEPDRAFDDSDISRFYKACPKELDHVLDLYFPKGDK